VYEQAYVHDRYWLDSKSIGPVEFPELPETATYREFERKYYKMPEEEQLSKETRNRLWELAEASQEAYSKWHEEQETIYTTNRSREVSERLHAGRMSLCPYFWSVISALVFYYGFVRSTRPFRRLFRRVAPALETAMATLMLVVVYGGLVGIVGFIGYGFYEIRDQIPTPASIVVSVKTEYREYRESQRQEAEHQAERAREQQEWERANPQEAMLRRQQEEQLRAQQPTWRDFARDMVRDLWGTFKSAVFYVGALVGSVIALVLVISLLMYLSLLFGKAFSFLARLLSPAVQSLSIKSMPESAFRIWLIRQFRRVANAWAAWWQFWNDTRELVTAFAKAKKERVCPYLTIENERPV
jgi:hypothetical protein